MLSTQVRAAADMAGRVFTMRSERNSLWVKIDEKKLLVQELAAKANRSGLPESVRNSCLRRWSTQEHRLNNMIDQAADMTARLNALRGEANSYFNCVSRS